MKPERALLDAAGALAVSWLVLGLAGCAAKTSPEGTPQAARTPPEAIGSLDALRSDLDRLFDTPPANQAVWAVAIDALEAGKRVFSLNAGKLATPASTVKIATLAAVGERLGWDFRFATELLASGSIVGDTLRGDLVVRGTGDPSIGSSDDWPTRAFEEFAEALTRAGVRAIEGRIIGDDNAFDDEGVPTGWMWDDLAYGFAAPVGALQFHENAVSVTIHPGPMRGDPATLEVSPATSGLHVASTATTGAANESSRISLRRLPGQQTLHVSGTVSAGSSPTHRTASVDNPTIYFIRAFRTALIASGIDVRGAAVDVDDVPELTGRDHRPLLPITSYRSPPIAELARVLMKESRNVYAESFLKVLGETKGESGSREAGLGVVEDVLQTWGVPSTDYLLLDGSGLSRYDLMTPEALVSLLRRMHLDPRHRDAFVDTLSIAGSDGTLKERLRGTRAFENVRAKTGSMNGVRTIAGYLSTENGQPLAFAILANHFNLEPSVIDRAIDHALVLLAGFTWQ